MTVTQQITKPQPSIKEVAARIVNECLQVQPDEQVTIFTWDHSLPYARSLALEVEKAQGVSITLLQDNDLYWSSLMQLPESQFSRRQKGFLSLLDQTDALIQLGGPKDPSNFTKVPGERTAKMLDGGQQIQDKMIERKIRIINLLVGLVTEERARTYGFDLDRWMRMVNSSLNVDHVEIGRIAERLAARIRQGTNARITTPTGTDLSFKLKGREVHVHDGIIDKADTDKGTLFETLPAGVIEHAPDENSAEGVVLYDQPTALAGKMLKGLRLEFKNGRVVKYSADENLEAFRGLYENAVGDKDRFADIAIGLNPDTEAMGFFSDRIVRGAVSVGIGSNVGIGGENKNVYGFEGTLKKPTLDLDGKRLVDSGKILA